MEIRLTSSGKSSQEPKKALDILHKIHADLQGKNIKPEKFSDRIIFMSMFNDVQLERKDNEDSCALTSRKIKEYASNFNDGHWAFLEPGEESKWYQGHAAEYGGKQDLRASQMVDFLEFRTSGILGCKPAGPWNSLYSCSCREHQLCIYGAVSKWCGPNSREASQSRPESARKMSPEIQIKHEDLKSLVDIPRLPHASGNRVLQNLKDFKSKPFMSKIEYLRTTAKFYHPIEKGKLLCHNNS